MIEELMPATPLVSSSRRFSMPFARRSSQPARRFSAPVRSRPAPRIIVATMLMTALPEKPLNSSSGSTRPDRPSRTSTTSATTSARMRSNRNITIVKPTSPSTSFMSVVSVSAVSIRRGFRESGFANREGTHARLRGMRPGSTQGGVRFPISNPESRIPAFVVQQVPHAVAEFLPARFEMGLRPPLRPLDAAARTGAIDQARRGIEHVPHLLGIVLPIGGEVQAAARCEFGHDQVRELGLDQAPLVVALLVPGVGEVDTDLVERAVGDLVAQHFHGVVVIQANVAGLVLRQRVEQAADARRVHFDAD